MPVAARARPTVRLPPRRSSFVGRAAELGEIAARLGRHAVVTLVGVGGVGKTALAVEAAWAEVSAGRAELACYVDLVPCRADDQVIAALVEGVGVRGAPAAAGLDAVVDAVPGARRCWPAGRRAAAADRRRHAPPELSPVLPASGNGHGRPRTGRRGSRQPGRGVIRQAGQLTARDAVSYAGGSGAHGSDPPMAGTALLRPNGK
jgi:hypothetical protein